MDIYRYLIYPLYSIQVNLEKIRQVCFDKFFLNNINKNKISETICFL